VASWIITVRTALLDKPAVAHGGAEGCVVRKWRVRRFVGAVVGGLAVLGCGRGEAPPVDPGPSLALKGAAPMTMDVHSSAFEDGGRIPKRYSGEGEDVSPALEWGEVPSGTKELALVCDAPDAPSPQPWVHWVIYKLAAELRGLPEGIVRKERLEEPAGAVQGKNSWRSDNVGYRGPMPPPGHGVHHYHFKLYALDAALGLAPGATKEELLRAMDGHVLGRGEVVGTYER
jgi:Raf kinase inhibitor-like YbhB/YbcL family protein